MSQFLRRFRKPFVRTLEAGITAAELRNLDPDHAAFTIMGMTTSYFARLQFSGVFLGAISRRPCADGTSARCWIFWSSPSSSAGEARKSGRKFFTMLFMIFVIAAIHLSSRRRAAARFR